jgi:hypothetical protein
LRSLDDLGCVPAVAHGKRIGLAEIAEIALVSAIRADVQKSVEKDPVAEMPGSQLSGGSEDGVDLALLREAQQEHDFVRIENLFSLRLFQNLGQSTVRVIHFDHRNELKLPGVLGLLLSGFRSNGRRPEDRIRNGF